jgi:endonuclease/exonuclease/phosphatase family metal-dependent hydrolase
MRRLIGSLVLIALSVGALFATWPQLGELEFTAPWVQIVSMRGLGAAAGLFLALVFVMLRAGARNRRGYLGALAFIFASFAVANAAILGVRGVFPGELPKPQAEQIRVTTWNTLGDEVNINTLSEVVDSSRADVVVLPETTQAHAEALAALLLNDYGSEYAVHTVAFDLIYKARSTSVLIDKSLGEYRITEEFGNTSVVPSIVLEPVDRGPRPRIVGIHAVSPIAGEMQRWREDQAWLSSVCELPNTIVAGDANATPDHLRTLTGCTFASVTSGAGGLGTWPTTLPAVLGAPVDVILSTAEWNAIGFSVISDTDAAGSDHRPVTAVLIPAKN